MLAQGQQTRLAQLGFPKQLLPLPACGGAPVIGRTARIVRAIQADAEVQVVSRRDVGNAVEAWDASVACLTLEDPGTSSLLGLWRCLTGDLRWPGRTVVLLGDVCYSWSCLSSLMRGSSHLFVGTSDLAQDRGELWGVAWQDTDSALMLEWVRMALSRHPPFAEYQCGQMRQWLFAGRDLSRRDQREPTYEPVDDYTTDFDTPLDLMRLEDVSRSARLDDALHGMTWDGGV